VHGEFENRFNDTSLLGSLDLLRTSSMFIASGYVTNWRSEGTQCATRLGMPLLTERVII